MTSTRASSMRRIGMVLVGAAALVLMLGTSVTAAQLITGNQIKDGTVTGTDLRNRSLTGADVRDRSLTTADYAGVVVGPIGPAGPTGPSGPTGQQGPGGVAGFRDITYATSDRHDLPAGRWTIQNARCPAGALPVAGGFAAESGAAGGRLLASSPLTDGSGWYLGIKNDGSSTIVGGYTWVTCARAR